METKTLAVQNGIIFIQSEGLMIASQAEQDGQGFFACEVVKAASDAGLPINGWRKSEFTESFIRGA